MNNTINYGIDLGTSNSAIARCDGEEVRVFKNRDQMDVTPSVVRVEKTGRLLVGRRAYSSLLSDPDNTAFEFKRWMGQSDKKKFTASGRIMSAEELSAEVLKSLLEDARKLSDDSIPACVITVPAAFGHLQCEATSRAASLAGLVEAPLLQEPLAASIAYGMKPDSRDKRWLVYDFGGGTFDVAVVSTKDGHLSIIEHRGDNMLGGKDFDRLIVDNLLWPALQNSYNIPSLDKCQNGFNRLYQRLKSKAEEAKIDLSTSTDTMVGIFDVGEDASGKPIEIEVSLTRSEVDRLAEPMILRTVELCNEAIMGTRMELSDIAAVLLVGGPTHMPILRDIVRSQLCPNIDFSIDPMTVVARGASVYASTLLRQEKTSSATTTTAPDAVRIDLAYETVWSETTCLVAGKIASNLDGIEVKIDAESGHWNSGWIPVNKGYFEADVNLLEGKTTRFWIYLRDATGNDLMPEPDVFSIRHGLSLAEPPLPHSIGVEVVRSDGTTEVDVIFPRSTPLPAEARKIYKATKTIRPNQSNEFVGVKLWEGEYLNAPGANKLVGFLKINASEIQRPLTEGADIELSISINTSRNMGVQAYVPMLNQHFSKQVYVPKENEEALSDKAKELADEAVANMNRIDVIEELLSNVSDSKVHDDFSRVREKNEELLAETNRVKQNKAQLDPDDAKRVCETAKDVQGRLASLEQTIRQQANMPQLLSKLQDAKEKATEVAQKFAGPAEKKQLELLVKDADRQIQREDKKGLEKTIEAIDSIKWHILFTQDWFWSEIFDDLSSGNAYLNREEAERLIIKGRAAQQHGDAETLREVVRLLWKLLPEGEAEKEMNRTIEAGIRRK